MAHSPQDVTRPNSSPLYVSTHQSLMRLPRDQAEKDRQAATVSANQWRANLDVSDPIDYKRHVDAGCAEGPIYRNGKRDNDHVLALCRFPFEWDAPVIEQARSAYIGDGFSVSGVTPSGNARLVIFVNQMMDVSTEPLRDLYRLRHAKLNYAHGFYSIKGYDKSCNSPARFFFGNRSGTTVLVGTRFLTLAEIDALPEPPQPEKAPLPAWDEPANLPTGDGKGEDYGPYVHGAYSKILRDLASLPSGRNKQGNASAFEMGRLYATPEFVKYLPPISRAEADLIGAMHSNGYVADHTPHKAEATIQSGLYSGVRKGSPKRKPQLRARTAAAPAPVKPVAAPAPRVIAADLYQNTPTITLPTGAGQTCIALRADIGVGKSEAAIDEIGRTPGKTLFLSYRKRLGSVTTAKAAQRNVTIEDYDSIPSTRWPSVKNLSICINSIPKLVEPNGNLPVYDLLIVDEVKQVLETLFAPAGTLEGDEAIAAATVYRELLRTAKRVIVLDAHLNDLCIAYLKEIRGVADTLVIHNTYQPDRGLMVTHDSRETAIAAGIAEMAKGRGPVVFADGSIEHAKLLAESLQSHGYSADDILLITAENAGNERQREFLRDMNKGLGKLKALIHTSVIGTGVSMTAPVAAVVGLFYPNTAPEDARQMIGRARAARLVHVYLPNSTDERPTNPDEIFEAELAKGRRTKQFIEGKFQSLPDISTEHRQWLLWHARMTAARNDSLNYLRERFIELCAGYKIQHVTGRNQALEAELQAIKEQRDERLKALALIVPAIDRKTYKRLHDDGKVDEPVAAGYRRGQIETNVGMEISPTLIERLWTTAQRRQVRALADLYDNIAEVMLGDAQEANEGIPLPRRQHRTARRAVRTAFLAVLNDDQGQPLDFTKDALEQAVAPVLATYAADLRRFFGWRPDRTHTAAAAVRRVLDTIGVKLVSEQRKVDGERMRFYAIGAGGFTAAIELATARLAMLERQRLEDRQMPVVRPSIGVVGTPMQAMTNPAPEPVRARPKPLLDLKVDVVAERRKAGLPLNPFAVAQ